MRNSGFALHGFSHNQVQIAIYYRPLGTGKANHCFTRSACSSACAIAPASTFSQTNPPDHTSSLLQHRQHIEQRYDVLYLNHVLLHLGCPGYSRQALVLDVDDE
ncbi:hypothetical protein H6F74_09150 [Trichocoleus sp. FACHB-90]|uniref:hypothetical protein n=1 Tax=Cyanophyceae TaxID=3028117 RepID=UPI001688F855|nr:hypothetical protein [Trichocoleus sp. FACHB-90]MBD1926414.1 hypothetical protein [Trichocoleus sp. FACHB-90]